MSKINKLSKFLTVFIMIIFPILDMKFFYSRITTLAQVLFVIIILIFTLIGKKDSRKSFIYLLLYYILVLIYLFINYLRSSNFTSLFPDNFNYSLYKELTTVIKLIMPVTILFILKYQNISKKEYFNTIKYWIIFICGSIIITNILKIGMSSYCSEQITYNIFEWFKDPYYLYSASKGYFNYANQQSCILIMLLVVSLYMFFEQNKKNIIYIIMLVVSMLMLGTRISSLGGLLVLIFVTIVYMVYKIIYKQKINKLNLLLLIPITLWIILLPVSPYSNRNNELYGEYIPAETEEEKEDQKEIKDKEKNYMINYINENHNPDRLPEMFFKEYYSYEYDSKFWYKFVKNTNVNDINYRMIEINIIKRVKKINNDKLDTYFGISNSRIQNIVNIERDFILHYYAFGIIGSIILLLVYPVLIIKRIIKIYKNKDIYDIFILIIIMLFLFCSYLSGNILNYIVTLIPLSYIVNPFNNDKIIQKN